MEANSLPWQTFKTKWLDKLLSKGWKIKQSQLAEFDYINPTRTIKLSSRKAVVDYVTKLEEEEKNRAPSPYSYDVLLGLKEEYKLSWARSTLPGHRERIIEQCGESITDPVRKNLIATPEVWRVWPLMVLCEHWTGTPVRCQGEEEKEEAGNGRMEKMDAREGLSEDNGMQEDNKNVDVSIREEEVSQDQSVGNGKCIEDGDSKGEQRVEKEKSDDSENRKNEENKSKKGDEAKEQQKDDMKRRDENVVRAGDCNNKDEEAKQKQLEEEKKQNNSREIEEKIREQEQKQDVKMSGHDADVLDVQEDDASISEIKEADQTDSDSESAPPKPLTNTGMYRYSPDSVWNKVIRRYIVPELTRVYT